MRTRKTTLHGLLGALILTAGFAAPIASAADEKSSDDSVSVRINLPDGSVVVQKAKKQPSRVRSSSPTRTSSKLSDGSRVSIGSSSSRSARRSSGARSATRGTTVTEKSTRSGSSMVVSTRPAREAEDTPPQSETTGTNSTVDSGSNISTIGQARQDGEDAIGGQTVSFKDIGMYGAVIGETVYLVGVELVHADQDFDTIRGTRIGADSAIMIDTGIPDTGHDFATFDSKTGLKLSFESGTVVTIEMYSTPDEDSGHARERRTWTVRIR